MHRTYAEAHKQGSLAGAQPSSFEPAISPPPFLLLPSSSPPPLLPSPPPPVAMATPHFVVRFQDTPPSPDFHRATFPLPGVAPHVRRLNPAPISARAKTSNPPERKVGEKKQQQHESKKTSRAPDSQGCLLCLLCLLRVVAGVTEACETTATDGATHRDAVLWDLVSAHLVVRVCACVRAGGNRGRRAPVLCHATVLCSRVKASSRSGGPSLS